MDTASFSGFFIKIYLGLLDAQVVLYGEKVAKGSSSETTIAGSLTIEPPHNSLLYVLNKIAPDVFANVPEDAIPDVYLKEIDVVYSSKNKSLNILASTGIGSSFEVTLFFIRESAASQKSLVAAARPVTNKTNSKYAVGVAISSPLKLRDLPLVGQYVAKIDLLREAGITNLGFFYANQPGSFIVEHLDDKTGIVTQTQPWKVSQAGFYLSAALQLEADKPEIPWLIPLSWSKPKNDRAQLTDGTTHALLAAPPAPPGAVTTTDSSDGFKWIKVNKGFGPVTIKEIGFAYQNKRAFFAISATFTLAGFTLMIQGLSISNPLTSFDPEFGLQGLGIDIQRGPLHIGGAFLHIGDDFLGMALVQVAQFGLTAIGGFAPKDNSFFIFVRLTAPLGGPPFFFITGLAGGFGINRSLDVPTIDNIKSFGLLPQNQAKAPRPLPTTLPAGQAGEQTLMDVLKATAGYIHPEPGEYWIAAGIDFTSFEIVNASALIMVSFGVSLEVTFIGIAEINSPAKLPPSGHPIVHLEITLMARFTPEQGLIAVEGRLTPASYIYAGLVRVSGGFAFYLWFGGPHAGDFVISVGGYHPRYKKPAHYPVVPRIQIVYQLGLLVIKGEAYFALAPHVIMAGLAISATWQSGPIKAWFDAGIDFLLYWKPFHYEADAYIHIGASFSIHVWFVRISITIHVGVDLSIWGPPFGGTATVDLAIIKFTIAFGDSQHIEPVSWEDFKTSFLPINKDKSAASLAKRSLVNAAGPKATNGTNPATANFCTGQITDGLLQDLRAKDDDEKSPVSDGTSVQFSWIVDPNHFVLSSNTVIPAKTAQYNDLILKNPFKAEVTGATSKDVQLSTGTTVTVQVGGQVRNDQAFDVTPGQTPVVYPQATVKGSADSSHSAPSQIEWETDFGIQPMGVVAADFSSAQQVTLFRLAEGSLRTDPNAYTQAVNDVALTPIIAKSQKGLWGTQPLQNKPALNVDTPFFTTLVGLQIAPMIYHPHLTRDADLWSLLFDFAHEVSWCFSAPDEVTPTDFQDKVCLVSRADGPHVQLHFQVGSEHILCEDYRLTALTATLPNDSNCQRLGDVPTSVDQARLDMVTSLKALGLALDPDKVDVQTLACYPLWDWPEIVQLGSEKIWTNPQVAAEIKPCN